eukprot:3785232-Amphidinium_carterae.2
MKGKWRVRQKLRQRLEDSWTGQCMRRSDRCLRNPPWIGRQGDSSLLPCCTDHYAKTKTLSVETITITSEVADRFKPGPSGTVLMASVEGSNHNMVAELSFNT